MEEEIKSIILLVILIILEKKENKKYNINLKKLFCMIKYYTRGELLFQSVYLIIIYHLKMVYEYQVKY